MVDVVFAPLPTLEAQMRRCMKKMADEERVELLARLLDGYCRHCGIQEESHPCHCENDE